MAKKEGTGRFRYTLIENLNWRNPFENRVPVEDLTLLSVVAVKLPLCITVSCRVRLQREGRGVFILVDEFHPEI